jgi:hypothetical protein
MPATAIQPKDTDWASQLSRRASDYLDEAAELEEPPATAGRTRKGLAALLLS